MNNSEVNEDIATSWFKRTKTTAIWIATGLLVLLLYVCIKTYNYNQIYYSFNQSEQEYLKDNLMVTQNIKELLYQIYKQKGSSIKLNRPQASSRQARHVWHKTKSLMVEYKLLKHAESLSKTDLPSQNEQIGPKQVNEILNQMYRELISISGKFGIENYVPDNLKPNKAIPVQVYNNLDEISQLLEGLQSSLLRPEIVYLYAEMIVSTLQELQAFKGYSAPLIIEKQSNKSPRDVYEHAYELLVNLKELSNKNGFEVPGGITLLKHDKGHIAPHDVYNLLVNIYAEIQAMRFEHNSSFKQRKFEIDHNITPSDVFNKLSEAHAIVELLL